MDDPKESLDSYVNAYRHGGKSPRSVVRKLFLYDHPRAFGPPHDTCFDIFEAIADEFKVPLGSVKAVGSAQVGYSYFKNRPFVMGQSDLDVAIVDAGLFQRYAELAFLQTNGYKDLTGFKSRDDAEAFRKSLVMGIFRPDKMPQSPAKVNWFKFFADLSTRYAKIFKNINAGVYFSEVFLVMKQELLVDKIKGAAR